jgi:sugar transferase (PEP-CTERM/EpsH1 system associated)
MRDLLYLAHRIPFPPDKGDKIRSFHILEHLRKSFRVHLGCFFDDPADANYVGALEQICASVNCESLPINVKRLRGLAGIALGQSITAASYQDAKMRRWVGATIARYGIEDAFIFSSAMAPYVGPFSSAMRITTDLVDMDSEKWRIYADNASFAPEFLYRREQQKVLELERYAASVSRNVLLVSEAEAESCRVLLPEYSDRLIAVVNGVDSQYFDPALNFCSPYDAAGPVIVFAGAMDYAPNVDAVTWFAEIVFPQILEKRRDAQFWIVGANPKSDVRKLLGSKNLHITGRVDDVRPYLAHSACVIAPMRIARGIQNKVLEGMAMAKSVVVTPAALQGLEAVPGRDLVTAQTDTDFAARVLEVISTGAAQRGAAARKYVLTHHDWRENLHVLDDLMSGQTPVCARTTHAAGALA